MILFPVLNVVNKRDFFSIKSAIIVSMMCYSIIYYKFPFSQYFNIVVRFMYIYIYLQFLALQNRIFSSNAPTLHCSHDNLLI